MEEDTVGVDLAQKKVFKSMKLWNKCIPEEGEKYENQNSEPNRKRNCLGLLQQQKDSGKPQS